MMDVKLRKISEVSAIITSMLIFLSTTIFTLSLPGYSLVDGYVSFLGSGASPYQAIINLSFALSGFSMLVLGYVLSGSLKKNDYTSVGKIMFRVSGVLLVLLAIFPSDPGLRGRLHQMIGNLAYILIPLSMVAFGAAFRKEPGWGKFFANSSFVLAGITLVCSLILKFFPIYVGLLERIGMGADLLWMVLVSSELYLKEQRLSLRTMTLNKISYFRKYDFQFPSPSRPKTGRTSEKI